MANRDLIKILRRIYREQTRVSVAQNSRKETDSAQTYLRFLMNKELKNGQQ